MASFGAFYERVVNLTLPVEWAAVSEDAKVDYVFNMFVSPRLVKLQWDATNLRSAGCQFESWPDGGCVVMKTTRTNPNHHGGGPGQVSYIQYSAYEPKRTGPRVMTISEYNVRMRKDFPTMDLDAASIKSQSVSNMFRHVEAAVLDDRVELSLKVDFPKMPADTPLCGPPCCCLPGCNYLAFPLFMSSMKTAVAPIYDVAMDAIEDDFRQRRLSAPIDAGQGVMALPVFEAELPIAQLIAIVPIQMVQVVTTTTTITGDPMTGAQWVTTTHTVTTTTTTMAVPSHSAAVVPVAQVPGNPASVVPVAQVVGAVPMAQAMERQPAKAHAIARASPMDGRMMEAASGCYVQRESPWTYFYLSFNDDHSQYSMGPGGCCLFLCPCPGACGVHKAQAPSSGTFDQVHKARGRTDRWEAPTLFVRTHVNMLGQQDAKMTFVKVC